MRPTPPVGTSLSELTHSSKGQGEDHHSRLWKRPDCPGKAERQGQQQGWWGGVKMLQVRGDEDLEQGCGRGDGEGDPDAERSTRRLSQVLNEDQRVENSWVSCLRRPLEKFSIYNENTEHSKDLEETDEATASPDCWEKDSALERTTSKAGKEQKSWPSGSVNHIYVQTIVTLTQRHNSSFLGLVPRHIQLWLLIYVGLFHQTILSLRAGTWLMFSLTSSLVVRI